MPLDLVCQSIADFDAVVLPHTGHFPMLERPDEFNRKLAETLAAI
jgi:pimeloyl-ACP methyl ester carboxylesterase